MPGFRAPTRTELMARFALGEDAEVINEVLELISRGPKHQARLPSGARVRIIAAQQEADSGTTTYTVELLDEQHRRTGFWALVDGSNLTEAPELSFWQWLRSR